MTSTLVRESRLPVGSSARMTLGLRDDGARDGHALLLSARELAGMVIEPLAEADALERLVARAHALACVRDALVEQRQLDVLDGAGAREQVEALEDEAERAVADLGELVAAHARHLAARRAGSAPDVGRSRQPTMFISVDLPEPELPMTATNSPASMASVDAAQRVHLDVAHLVDLVDVVERDQRRHRLRTRGTADLPAGWRRGRLARRRRRRR